MELPSLPDFITRRGPYISSGIGEGIQTISLYEFDNTRMAEALITAGNYYVAMRDIPGFNYSVTVFNEVQEALNMIGLA